MVVEYDYGDTWFAAISKNGIQKAYSQSSSFSICIFSYMAGAEMACMASFV